jgi:hypothetical protein
LPCGIVGRTGHRPKHLGRFRDGEHDATHPRETPRKPKLR